MTETFDKKKHLYEVRYHGKFIAMLMAYSIVHAKIKAEKIFAEEIQWNDLEPNHLVIVDIS